MSDVTVYIPTRNRAHLVMRAIGSLLTQGYKDWKCIIVDDGSADDTFPLVSRLALADTRIEVVRSDKNLGPCAARNLAIERATTEFVTGLDDDDMFLPNRLEDLLGEARKGTRIVASQDLYIKNGKVSDSNRPRVIDAQKILSRNWLGNQALARRSDFIAVGGFDTEMRSSQDYDLWIRLINAFGPAVVVNRYGQLIFEEAGTGRITDDPSRQIAGMERLLQKHRARMSLRQQWAHKARQSRVAANSASVLYAMAGFDFSLEGMKDVRRSVLALKRQTRS